MGFYGPDICVDSFEPDPDGLLRVWRYEVEEGYGVGSIEEDEIMGFARVVRFEGDRATGWICLEQLVGEVADQTAVDLELSYEDWCDPLT